MKTTQDFQVREPVHSLFGKMHATNQMVEFEATQEYLGQAKHVCRKITSKQSNQRQIRPVYDRTFFAEIDCIAA